MIVEQIWTANSGRNFNYLIACAETGEALAVDPLDHEKCLAAAKAKGWNITQILNTHEHRDCYAHRFTDRRRDARSGLTAVGALGTAAGNGTRRPRRHQPAVDDVHRVRVDRAANR